MHWYRDSLGPRTTCTFSPHKYTDIAIRYVQGQPVLFLATNTLISRFVRSKDNLCFFSPQIHRYRDSLGPRTTIALTFTLLYVCCLCCQKQYAVEWAPCHHALGQLQAGRRVSSHPTNVEVTWYYFKHAVAEIRKRIEFQLRDKTGSKPSVGTGYARHLDPKFRKNKTGNVCIR